MDAAGLTDWRGLGCVLDESKVVAAASCMQAGAAVEWLRQVFHAGLDAHEAYEQIAALASQSRPGAGGVIFTPWLAGERAPFLDTNARACFVGISSATSQADLHRAVLEGEQHAWGGCLVVVMVAWWYWHV